MKIVLRIFGRFSSVYLATGGSTARRFIGVSSWLDSREDKDFDGPLEVRSFASTSTALDGSHFGSKSRAEQSGVNLKQRYPNGLADLLGVKQLELLKGEAHIQDHVLSL